MHIRLLRNYIVYGYEKAGYFQTVRHERKHSLLDVFPSLSIRWNKGGTRWHMLPRIAQIEIGDVYLWVGKGLHPEIVHRFWLEKILHVQLVAPGLLYIGHAKVEPLCVPIRIDVEGQLEVVLRLISGSMSKEHVKGLK